MTTKRRTTRAMPTTKIRSLKTFFAPTENNGYVTIARDVKTGSPTHVDTGNGAFTCFGCGGTLLFRRSHRRHLGTSQGRRGYCNTSLIEVRGHFVHALHNDQKRCSRESWNHAAAKAIILHHPDYPLDFHCGECQTKKPFRFLPRGLRWVSEHRLGDAWGRVVDVALLDRHNRVLGAVEVQHTHACDNEKCLDLCDAVGLGWCELRASDVLRCTREYVPIPVSVCAHGVCDVCTESRRIQLQGTRARIEQSRKQCEEIETLDQQLTAILTARINSEEALRKTERYRQMLAISEDRNAPPKFISTTTKNSTSPILEFGHYRGVRLDVVFEFDRRYVINKLRLL